MGRMGLRPARRLGDDVDGCDAISLERTTTGTGPGGGPTVGRGAWMLQSIAVIIRIDDRHKQALSDETQPNIVLSL